MKLNDAHWIAPLLSKVAEGGVLQFYHGAVAGWVDFDDRCNFNEGQARYRIKPPVAEYRLYRYGKERSVHIVQRNLTKNLDRQAVRIDELAQSNQIHWITDWLPIPEDQE
jgi:hypothetical protein